MKENKKEIRIEERTYFVLVNGKPLRDEKGKVRGFVYRNHAESEALHYNGKVIAF